MFRNDIREVYQLMMGILLLTDEEKDEFLKKNRMQKILLNHL